jgi:hypothetical protein
MSESREPIYCDCCGKEVMAWRVNGRIIVNDRRHGERHTVSLDVQRELERYQPALIEEDG